MLSLSAYAEAPKYSYAELAFDFIDVDFSDDDDDDEFDKGSGGSFAGSYGFDNFQVFGQWGTSSLDFKGEDTDGPWSESVDVTEWLVGGGWHGTMGEPADLVIDFGYLNTKLGGDIDTDEKTLLQGYFADIGIRWRIVKFFEINAFYTYADLDSAGASNTYELNAMGYIGRVVVGLILAEKICGTPVPSSCATTSGRTDPAPQALQSTSATPWRGCPSAASWSVSDSRDPGR